MSSVEPNSAPETTVDPDLESPSSIGRAVREMIFSMDDEGVILLDPREIFDEALIGITEGHGGTRAVYDSEKCIEQLMGDQDSGDGMSYEDASEFFSFNTLGTYVEGYPVFVRRPLMEQT